jgi:LysR family hydrogen peroxide-inducible transcriptional activator
MRMFSSSEPRITLRQLKYFVVSSKHSSFRRAAKELNISQPSLSVQVQKLEELVGVDLFERARSGIALTPIGRELLGPATETVRSAESFSKIANFKEKGTAGTYHFGVTPLIGPYLLPWIIPQFHRNFSAVKLSIREECPQKLLEGLVEGRIDILLAPMRLNRDDLISTPLILEPLNLVMHQNHDLASENTVTKGHLKGHGILTLDERTLLFQEVQKLCLDSGATLKRDFEGTSLETIAQMIAMESGISIMPALFIHSGLANRKEFCIKAIADESLQRTHYLTWRASSPLQDIFSSMADFFREEIKSRLGKEVTVLH